MDYTDIVNGFEYICSDYGYIGLFSLFSFFIAYIILGYVREKWEFIDDIISGGGFSAWIVYIISGAIVYIMLLPIIAFLYSLLLVSFSEAIRITPTLVIRALTFWRLWE